MYDVLIAGAGTGGAALAGMLAAKGRSVLLVDARPAEALGHDWCGSVEKRAFQITGVGGPLEGETAAPIQELVIAAPDPRRFRTILSYPSFIVDRRKLGQRLVRQAVEAGAEFRENARALYPLYDENKVFGAAIESGGRVENVMARITVDATGLAADLRTKLPPEWEIDTAPIAGRDVVHAYHEVRRFRPHEAQEPSIGVMSLRYGQHGWYSWVNREAPDRIDFGAGVVDVPGAPDPKDLVAQEAMGWRGVDRVVLRGGGGRLPVRRAIENLVWNGFLVLGDAGSQAMPLSGANCGTVLLAARIAADVCQEALAVPQPDLSHLWRYNVQYHRARGAVLASFDVVRTMLQTIRADDLTFLFWRELLTDDQIGRAWHFRPLPFSGFQAAANLARGALRPRLARRVNNTLSLADAVLRHYHQFPQAYEPDEFRVWVARARELYRRAGEG